jgi:DNA repair exonuclease SbcCD nuclease subunit
MKFAHIGDTHIGASNFKLEERKKDFHRAFEEAIDNCIENNVDIVIQTGDLFDVGRPAVSDIVFAIEQLARLKEKGIPFFTVPGSHDVYLNETPISILEKLGLVTNVGSSRYFEQKENGKTEHKG